jgi:general secretion pathway protein D
MRRRNLFHSRTGRLALTPAAALLAFAVDAAAQAPPLRPMPGGRLPLTAAGAASAPAITAPPPPPPAAPTASPSTAGASSTTTPTSKPDIGPDGKAHGNTTGLTQFEQGVEFQPRGPEYRVAFSLEDADLPELVRVIGELTGKRFIFGGKVRNIKATVFSPQKVTVAEAYQAFLSILEANGLTVVPHGRFLKIVETPGIAAAGAPVYGAGQGTPNEERYVTRIHRLAHVSADDASAVLGHFKSKDGDITVYGPGNLLIITDTGTNIRRMMQIIEDIDVGGVGDQIWIEPIHYTAASDIANRLNDVFDLHGSSAGGSSSGSGGTKGGAAAGGVPSRAGSSMSDLHIAKIIPDDRSNSLIIVSTERAYLRVLEFIKRIDVPHSGEGEIHVLPLQHADAVDLAKTLNEIITGATQASSQTTGGAGARPGGAVPLTGVFESGVKISADKATNSIVITSSLRDYAAMRIVIDQLDQPRRQVFIEAVIMDLTISRQNQLGMSFHAGDVETSPVGTGQITTYGGLNPFRSILLPSPTDSTLSAFALGVRGPGLTGTENLFGTGVSIPAFGILINAMASTNDADILSTPHILATDNVKAEISVGQNIALQQNAPSFGGLPGATGAAGLTGGLGGIGGFGATAPRQDIGTKITITPHLNDSNEVRLEVVEEISDVIGNQPQGSLGTIPFAKRTANTQLVVKDQQTVVIGGLVRNRVARADTKIPILGDIPVLGALFRSSTDSLDKTNLLLILTPHIIRDQDDLRVIFERKMQERQEFLDHYFVFSDQTDYKPPIDYSRVSGLLEEIRQAYFSVEERKHIDELSRPKGIKTHDPGEPIEMPAASRGDGDAAETTPGAPPGAPPPPNLNVNPPARNIERVEH